MLRSICLCVTLLTAVSVVAGNNYYNITHNCEIDLNLHKAMSSVTINCQFLGLPKDYYTGIFSKKEDFGRTLELKTTVIDENSEFHRISVTIDNPAPSDIATYTCELVNHEIRKFYDIEVCYSDVDRPGYRNCPIGKYEKQVLKKTRFKECHVMCVEFYDSSCVSECFLDECVKGRGWCENQERHASAGTVSNLYSVLVDIELLKLSVERLKNSHKVRQRMLSKFRFNLDKLYTSNYDDNIVQFIIIPDNADYVVLDRNGIAVEQLLIHLTCTPVSACNHSVNVGRFVEILKVINKQYGFINLVTELRKTRITECLQVVVNENTQVNVTHSEKDMNSVLRHFTTLLAIISLLSLLVIIVVSLTISYYVRKRLRSRKRDDNLNLRERLNNNWQDHSDNLYME